MVLLWLQEALAGQVLRAQEVSLGPKAHKGKLDPRVHRDQEDFLEKEASQVYLALQVQEERLDHLGWMVDQDLEERQGPQGQVDQQERGENPDHLVNKVLEANQEKEERQVLQDLQDQLGQEVKMDHRDLQEDQDHQVSQGREVNLDL